MQIVAQKLVEDALRLTGYLAANKSANASDAQLALEELQGMMDSWRTENLLDVSSTVVSVEVAANQQTVTIGPATSTFTPDIVVDMRPEEIISGFWIDPEQQNAVPMSEARDKELWRSWRDIKIQSTYPIYFMYDQNWPVATLTFYPLPAQAMTLNLGIETFTPIPQLLSDTMDLAPSWLQALKYNLASLLGMSLPLPDDNNIAKIDAMAAKTMARIKRARMRPQPRAVMDPTLLRGRYSSGGQRFGYNFNSDSYNGIL